MTATLAILTSCALLAAIADAVTTRAALRLGGREVGLIGARYGETTRRFVAFAAITTAMLVGASVDYRAGVTSLLILTAAFGVVAIRNQRIVRKLQERVR